MTDAPGRRAAYALARRPDRTGVAVRDGIELAWSAYGETGPAVVLLPTWSIIDSRFWKAQVGYLARHFRVVRFDGRGTGASSRPRLATAYTDECFAEDAVAVMDAVGFDRAVLVGYSAGGPWALHAAATHPDRVAGVFAIAPAIDFACFPGTGRAMWQQPEPGPEGWPRYNKYYWRAGGFDDFRTDFFAHLFSDPHSTKPIEDFLDWSTDIDPETLIAANDGRLGLAEAICSPIEPLLERIHCPVTVLHGGDDQVNPLYLGEELARLTDGSLLELPGAGHGPLARYPVRVNHEIRRFTEQVHPPAASGRSWVPAATRSPPGAVPVLTDRSRPRPPGSGDRHRAAPAPTRPAGRLAGPAPGHPSAGRLRRDGAPRVGRTWPASPPTSKPRRASTTCTPLLPSGGWTRSSCTTSVSSTTWCRTRRTTWWSGTRPGTWTTSCTRTPSSSGLDTPGSPTSSAGCRCPTEDRPRPR